MYIHSKVLPFKDVVLCRIFALLLVHEDSSNSPLMMHKKNVKNLLALPICRTRKLLFVVGI